MDKSIKNNWNKKGAVNSYRFIAMYIIIGIVITGLSLMYQQTETEKAGWELKSLDKLGELSTNINTIDNNIVKANQFTLTSGYGNEGEYGKNIFSALNKGFIPQGLIPKNYQASALEYTVNNIIIFFRWIILLFAGFELFQILFKGKTS